MAAQANPFADLIPGAKPSGGITLTPPKPREAPSGYRYDESGNLVAIPGGPADPAKPQPPTPNQSFDNADKLRSEFNNLPEVKQFKDVASQLGGALRAPDTGQGDLSIIYAFGKIADPGSVVREGELTLAQNTGSVIEDIERRYGRIGDANRLPPNVRRGLVEAMRQKVGALNQVYSQSYQRYRSLAGQHGFDPEQITGPHVGDAVRPLEEGYIRASGGTPRRQDGTPAGQAAREESAPSVTITPTPIDPEGVGDIGFNNADEAAAVPPGGEEFQRRFQQALASGEIPPDPYAIIGWAKENGANVAGGISISFEEAKAAAEAMKKGVMPSVLTPQYVTPDISDARGQGGVAESVDAVVRGAAEVFPFTNQMAAAADTVTGDGTFSENMNRQLTIDRYDEQHNFPERIAGTIGGALLIPSGVRQAATREAAAVLRAGGTRAEAVAAARRVIPIQLAKEGGAYGSLYGAGQSRSLSELPGNIVEGGVTGGLAGAAIGAAGTGASRGIDWLSEQGVKAIDDAAVEAAKAAEELDIDLPKFVVGGAKARSDAAALEQSPFGVRQISDATNKMLEQADAARQRIAGAVGTAAEPEAMGEIAVDAGNKAIRAARKRVGRIYDGARKEAQNTPFLATDTKRVFREIVDAEKEGLGQSKVGAIIEDMAADLEAKRGRLTIDGARDTRSRLRTRLRTEAELTPDNADRITNMVMDAIGSDLERGLRAAGKSKAIPLYRRADAEWAKLREIEEDVLKPYIGKDGDAWGSDAAKRLSSDIKGNGVRLARFLNSLPEQPANDIRASLIMRLGRSRSGSQDAEGAAFSLDTFLTNWDEIKAARNLIFPKETVRLLDGLAKVAEQAKAAGRTKGHSNTGRSVWKALMSAPGLAGGGVTLLTSDPKYLIAGVTVAGLSGLKQWNAARLLASPDFAKKLASTPANAKAARNYWSRPWVETLAKANPQIGREVTDFQRGVLNALNDNMPAQAAASEQEQ